MEHQTESGWPGAARADAVANSPAAAGADGVAEPHAADTGAEPHAADAVETPAPATGEPRVDAALRLLDRLPGLPVSEHPELFEQVHAQLSEVLGELDSGPASSGPAGR